LSFKISWVEQPTKEPVSDFTRSLARASIVNGENAGVVNETTRLQRARNTTDANEMAYRDTVSKSLVGMGDSLKVAKSGAESLTTGAMEFTASSMGLLEKAIATLGQNKLDGDIMKKSSMATIMAFDPSSRALRVTDKNGPADPMQIYQNTAFSNDISGEASYDGFKTGTKNVTGERFPNFGTPRHCCSGAWTRGHNTEGISHGQDCGGRGQPDS